MARQYFKYNISSWGKSSDTNILFIIGTGGSGKTTLALDLAKKNNALIVNLDSYFEHITPLHYGYTKELNLYLAENNIDYTMMSNRLINIKDRFKVVDKFQDALIGWSKLMYSKGIKIIVEGVQLLDATLFEDKNFFIDKPVIMIKCDLGTLSKTEREPGERPNIEGLKKQLVMVDKLINLFNSKSNKNFSERINSIFGE